jgi:hypothetical protein
MVTVVVVGTGCTGSQPPLTGAVSEVVLDSCDVPRVPTTTPERDEAPYSRPGMLSPVSPACSRSMVLSPPFILRTTDGGIDPTDELRYAMTVTADDLGELCRIQLRVVGEAPPKEPGDPILPPPPRPVRLRLCRPMLGLRLPLADLDPPVLRRVNIVGATQTTPLLTTPLPLQVVGPDSRADVCVDEDAVVVDVDDYVASAVFTVDIPMRTLARVSSQAVGGDMFAFVVVEPR